MSKEFKIYPGEGTNTIKLGMSLEKVLEILGEPEEEEDYTYDDGLNSKTLYYDKTGMDLNFDKEDSGYVLTGVTFSDDRYFINEKVKVGSELEKVLQWGKENNQGDPLIEEAEVQELKDHTLYGYEELGTYFWVVNKKVIEIQLEPKD